MGDATCGTCPFWDARTDGAGGRCRAHPPAQEDTRGWCWSFTGGDEWCGEHPARQRDRLAAMAMQGILANPGPAAFGLNAREVASDAYRYAAAMLAEREKDPTP